MPEPVRNGMTLGELAQYMRRRTPHPGVHDSPQGVSAVTQPTSRSSPCRTGTATNSSTRPASPGSTHRPTSAASKPPPSTPASACSTTTNISVGRGTATPFEVFGAGAPVATKDAPAIPAWFDGKAVAAYLTARNIPGVSFAPTNFAVADDANHYPYHGQTIDGIHLTVTDRTALDSPELGIEILSALHHLYPTQFKLEKAAALVANTETMAALARGDDPRAIAAGWAPALAEFKARREKYLLYH